LTLLPPKRWKAFNFVFQGQTDTVLFHLSALTGSDSTQDELLQGQELPSGTAFFLNTDRKAVLLVDKNLNIHQYLSARALPQLHFALLRDGRLVGYRITEEGGQAYETWKLTLPPGEEIQAVIPPANPGGPIASVGRVLGNRTTLYKYLNPHLVVVLTQPIAETETPGKCGLRVVDNVKGTIVYSVVLPKGEGKCEVRPVLSENWLVYHYWDPGSESQGAGETAKGWRMVSIELYEGSVDEKYQRCVQSPGSPTVGR
jgi:ER membrane protein complex subunit 1